jgi:type I restriction enzyme S subunit
MNAHDLRVEEAPAPYRVAPLLTDHLDTFASAPEGFKRLRELVLNLAVRGRLVPQDPKDEPAERLFDRIRKEKATLSLKREKALEPIADDDVPYDLPHSWRWVRLPEICHDWGQKVPNGPFTYIDVGAIDNERGVITNNIQRLDENNAPSRARKIVRAGTVLYSTVRPYLLNVAVVERTFEPEPIASTAFAVLHPLQGINGRFLFYYLRSQPFIDFVASKMVGVAYPAINDSNFFSGLFPLPPVAEQSRIVAKVEELMALIDALEAKVGAGETARGKLLDALLATLADSPDAAATAEAWTQLAPHFDLLLQTPADVDRLQQTLLTLAVKGRLVPQDPNDEPATELLKRIRAEKERLVAKGKIKRDKLLPEIGSEEEPYTCPGGWRWARFGNVFQVTGGVTLGRELTGKRTASYPYLRVANVQRGALDLRQIKEVEIAEGELERYRLQRDDLLITEGGDWDKVGRTAIWRNEIESCLHQNHVFRARRVVDTNVEWVALFMNSAIAMAYFQASAKQTTNLASINMGELKSCVVPVPPVAEQSRIVAAVASLTALCDRLRERLAARRELAAKFAAALTESALQ